MVTARDLQRLTMSKHRRQSMRIASDLVPGSDRDQRRTADPGDFRRAHRLARSPDAGGERPPVAAVAIGESAEHVLDGVGDLVERGGLHRPSDPKGQADAIDEMIAKAA